MPRNRTKGRILVATPVLSDPNFDRTLVFMLEDNDDGSLGVVLNNPSDTTVGATVPELAWIAGADDPVFVGGPVSPEVALAIAECPGECAGFTPVVHDIGTLDLSEGEASSVDIGRGRLYSGYSGWAPGQLQAELDAGAWFVVDLHPDDAFMAETVGLWERVLRRQRGEIAWFANYPIAPEVN
ncbi:MAG: YqgE/AlgH family protein [Acidimicrobiia bacterium]|nr:YqgE/AlgH family protein [Acidimicrobiia bacterium]